MQFLPREHKERERDRGAEPRREHRQGTGRRAGGTEAAAAGGGRAAALISGCIRNAEHRVKREPAAVREQHINLCTNFYRQETFCF